MRAWNELATSGLAIAGITVLAVAQQGPPPGLTAPGTAVTNTYFITGRQYGGWLMTAFDSIPASKYGYRPTPAQLSVGTVAAHLEKSNYLLCGNMAGTPHPMTGKDTLADSLRGQWPKDTLVARLKTSFEFCTAAFQRVNDANLADSMPVVLPSGTRKFLRARLTLVFVTDLVDHYSQIANYMRLNGMIPPSSYPPPKK